MFHLSLPVTDYVSCLDFYRAGFGAEVVHLSPTAANVFVFGGQLTLHDDPRSAFTDGARDAMHFGAAVPIEHWFAIFDALVKQGIQLVSCIEPEPEKAKRGKLLLRDPSGNMIEINSLRASQSASIGV